MHLGKIPEKGAQHARTSICDMFAFSIYVTRDYIQFVSADYDVQEFRGEIAADFCQQSSGTTSRCACLDPALMTFAMVPFSG